MKKLFRGKINTVIITLHKPQRASSVSFSAFFFAYKIYIGYVNAYILNIEYICICEDELMHVMYYHAKENVEIKINQSKTLKKDIFPRHMVHIALTYLVNEWDNVLWVLLITNTEQNWTQTFICMLFLSPKHATV